MVVVTPSPSSSFTLESLDERIRLGSGLMVRIIRVGQVRVKVRVGLVSWEAKGRKRVG